MSYTGRVVHVDFRPVCSLAWLAVLKESQLQREFYLMAARQERIDAFIHEGSPPADQPLEILCEDHVGTYVIPFLCQWTEGTWQNAKTRRRIEAAVIGWREPKRDQR